MGGRVRGFVTGSRCARFVWFKFSYVSVDCCDFFLYLFYFRTFILLDL